MGGAGEQMEMSASSLGHHIDLCTAISLIMTSDEFKEKKENDTK